MAPPVILIVDDEKHTRDGLARALSGAYAVATAENGTRALEWLKSHEADVVLSDLRMPGMGGMELLDALLKMPNQPTVILLTAYGSVETAVEAMKRGAYDFLEKPVNLDRLDLLVERAVAQRALGAENRRLRAALDGKFGSETFIGRSPAMAAVMDRVRKVAPVDTTVLIQGESGTGKELVAHAIHQLSGRASRPFVAVHCAALAPTLLESELFGHERGAFSGATEQRKGRFELADGGTLFLDEIGEISPEVQVKILRVLESRSFERVGGTETLHVDVRLVTATNRDLWKMVEEKKFREDLFYRLFVLAIELPPLRDREGDVALLARHYLTHFTSQYGRDVRSISPQALDALCAYRWPGNIRELRNVMERMVVLATSPVLGVADLPEHIRHPTPEMLATPAAVAPAVVAPAPAPAAAIAAPPPVAAPVVPLPPTAALTRESIVAALEAAHGNRARAAKALGVSRSTFYRRLIDFGIEEKQKKSP